MVSFMRHSGRTFGMNSKDDYQGQNVFKDHVKIDGLRFVDVSKWRDNVNRVHRNRSSCTNPNNEGGACMVVFKKDHKQDFKFLPCWEELRHCTKWQMIRRLRM